MPKNVPAEMSAVDETDSEVEVLGQDAIESEEDLSGLDRGDSFEAKEPEETPPSDEPAEVEEQVAGAVEEEPEEPEEPVVEATASTAPPKGHFIPKSRFDEVNERRKAAERRNAEYERMLQLQDPNKVAGFNSLFRCL